MSHNLNSAPGAPSLPGMEKEIWTAYGLAAHVQSDEWHEVSRLLVNLGVVNPGDLGDIMDAMMDSFKLAVTEEVVQRYMMAFEYSSAHSKVEASLRASELIDPVYRLVRATRLGDILSEFCAAILAAQSRDAWRQRDPSCIVGA